MLNAAQQVAVHTDTRPFSIPDASFFFLFFFFLREGMPSISIGMLAAVLPALQQRSECSSKRKTITGLAPVGIKRWIGATRFQGEFVSIWIYSPARLLPPPFLLHSHRTAHLMAALLNRAGTSTVLAVTVTRRRAARATRKMARSSSWRGGGRL